jgi:hypothetical protein
MGVLFKPWHLMVLLTVACGFLVPFIFYILTLTKALGKCAPMSVTIEPGMLWLLLVPFVNMVWHFFCSGGDGEVVEQRVSVAEYACGGCDAWSVAGDGDVYLRGVPSYPAGGIVGAAGLCGGVDFVLGKDRGVFADAWGGAGEWGGVGVIVRRNRYHVPGFPGFPVE